MKLRPPPSLDPRCIDHRLPIDPATGERVRDATVASVRNAFSSAYAATENLIGLRDAVAADQTMTPAARELKIRVSVVRFRPWAPSFPNLPKGLEARGGLDVVLQTANPVPSNFNGFAVVSLSERHVL